MIVAAIDLGSNALRLKIVEFYNHATKVIDEQNVKILMGEEVYKSGHVSHASISHIVSILEHFNRCMHDFGVEKYRAVATGAMRDAHNSMEVQDIIKMKTGIHIEILEDSIEKYLTYKSMYDVLPNYRQIRESAIVVEVNSGSTDVTTYKNNRLLNNDELDLGFKMTKNFLLNIEAESNKYPDLLKKYVQTVSRRTLKRFGNKKFNSFLSLGGHMKTIKNIFPMYDNMPVSEFSAYCQELYKNKSKIREQVGDNWYEFLISMVIFDVFSESVKAKYISFPKITLRDGVIASIIAESTNLKGQKLFDNDIYSMTLEIAKKFNCIPKHIKNVEANALMLFDALSQTYKFNSDDRKLLRLSAMLNEVGRYTKLREYEYVSFDTISNLDIFGVSRRELSLVAHISRNLITKNEVMSTPEDTMRVKKLSLILKMAIALDSTRNQHVLIQSVDIHEDGLEIRIKKGYDATLEIISFKEPANDFYNTFGIQASIVR